MYFRHPLYILDSTEVDFNKQSACDTTKYLSNLLNGGYIFKLRTQLTTLIS